jgi:hypothetical protein
MPPAVAQTNLDNVPFVSNGQLRTAPASKAATPEQVNEAARINTDARLVALKISFFTLAGLALLAFFPAGGLPGYVRGEVPDEKSASTGQAKVSSIREQRPVR